MSTQRIPEHEAFGEDRRAAARGDCLVLVEAPKRTPLGKTFLLNEHLVHVGRGENNDVVLDDDTVSRSHCHLELRGIRWFVVDDGSTNGTFVNHEPLTTEGRLHSGDVLTVTKYAFKFLSERDLESRYHEEMEVQGLAILDPVSKAYRTPYFKSVLVSEVNLALRLGRPLSVLMLEIDYFTRVRGTHGHEAGARLIGSFARLAKDGLRRDEIIACDATEKFAVLLPRVDQSGAVQRAEDLRAAVEARGLALEGGRVSATISVGCASLKHGEPIASYDNAAKALLGRADALLYEATRLGRNCTQAEARKKYVRPLKQVLDGPQLFAAVSHASRAAENLELDSETTLLQEPPFKAVLAFEIDNEAGVHLRLGARTYDQWLRELIDHADEMSDAGDLLGLWRHRFLVLATRARNPQALSAAIVKAWRGDTAVSGRPGVARALKTSMLTKDEIATEGERGLDVLIARVTDIQRTNGIPYPFAVYDSIIASFPTAEAKSKRLLLGIERAMQFLAFVELATLRDYGDDATLTKVASLLATGEYMGSKPLGFGLWESLARGLAKHMPDTAPSPINRALRKLFGSARGRSWISESVENSVPMRNAFTHGGGARAERSYEKEVSLLLPVWEQIIAALAPLVATRLVSVDHLLAFSNEDEEEMRYVLHEHTGPSEIFPAATERVPARLVGEWCYLLIEGAAPLSLAPFVFARSCKTCERIEVYMTERIVLGPKDAKLQSKAVPSGHEATAAVPSSKKLQRVYEAVEQRCSMGRLSGPTGPSRP